MLLINIEELKKENPDITIDEINLMINDNIKIMKKEELRIYRKEYYYKNRDKILEYRRNYYKKKHGKSA